MLLSDFEELIRVTPSLQHLLEGVTVSSSAHEEKGNTGKISNSDSGDGGGGGGGGDNHEIGQEAKATEIFSNISLHDWIPSFSKEHEKQFYSDWFQFVMNSKDWPLLKSPIQLEKDVFDLYELYFQVTARGGFEKIKHNIEKWEEVIHSLRNPSCRDYANSNSRNSISVEQIRNHYRTLLLSYETFNNELITPTSHTTNVREDVWNTKPPSSVGDRADSPQGRIFEEAKLVPSLPGTTPTEEPKKCPLARSIMPASYRASPELVPLLANMMPEALPLRKRRR